MRLSQTVGAIAALSLLTGASLAAPPPALSQTAARAVEPDRDDAERLYRQARRVEAADDRSMQLTAAWLYREAARLWPENHEKRYRSLWRAAHLYLHHGRAKEAAPLLSEAGRQARRKGRPERAATCYLRLARLAAEQGDDNRARKVLQVLQPLLSSGRLDTTERNRLRAMATNVRTMITEVAESSS